MSLSTSQTYRGHRARLWRAAFFAAACATACGPEIQVRTAVSPEAATLPGRRTFRVVEAKPASRDSFGIPDPMIDNSITSRAVHDQIRAAFEARGYRYSKEHPDFEVTFEAMIAPILDIQTYDWGYGGYGYGYGPGFYGYRSSFYDGPCCYNGYGGGYGSAVGTFDRSSVVISVVDPGSKKLLWRGQGTSDGYSNPKKYLKELKHAVNAVAKKFPPSMVGGQVVATQLEPR